MTECLSTCKSSISQTLLKCLFVSPWWSFVISFIFICSDGIKNWTSPWFCMCLLFWISKSKDVLYQMANSYNYWFVSLVWLLKGPSSAFGAHINFLEKSRLSSAGNPSSLRVSHFNYCHISFMLREGENPTISQPYPLGWLGIRSHICFQECIYL